MTKEARDGGAVGQRRGLRWCKQGLAPLRVLRPLLAGLGKVCVPEALGIVTGYREGISVSRKGRTPRDSYRSIWGDPGVSRAGFAFTKPKEVTGGVPAQDLMML